MLNFKSFASSSKGNCYLLQNEETKILIELGVEPKELRKYLREAKTDISEINACIVSHVHKDHSLSIEYMLDITDIYSTFETYMTNKNVKAIEILKPFKIGTIKILAIPIDHGKTENYGFVFMDKESCVFFGTDFSLMQQNVSNFKFDIVAIECNYDDTILQNMLDNCDEEKRIKYIRQVSTHMSKENCKEHLRHMNLENCKEIILLHASTFLISKEQTKKEFEKEFKVKTYFAREK